MSIYGAVLSTVRAILHWRRDRGRFSVSPEVLHIKLLDEKMIVWRLIEIINAGRRPLYLDDFGFVRANGELESMRGRERDTDFPLKLEEGRKHRSMTPKTELHHMTSRSFGQRIRPGRSTIPELYRLGRFHNE